MGVVQSGIVEETVIVMGVVEAPSLEYVVRK